MDVRFEEGNGRCDSMESQCRAVASSHGWGPDGGDATRGDADATDVDRLFDFSFSDDQRWRFETLIEVI